MSVKMCTPFFLVFDFTQSALKLNNEQYDTGDALQSDNCEHSATTLESKPNKVSEHTDRGAT